MLLLHRARLLDARAVLLGEVRRAVARRARRGAAGSSSKLRHVTRDLVAVLERGERGLEAALADVAPGAGDVGPDLDVHGGGSLPTVVQATTSRVARAPLAGARAGAIVVLCERSAIFPPARSPCCSATSKARRRSRAGSATRGPWLSLTTGLSCGARLTTTVVSSWAPRATVLLAVFPRAGAADRGGRRRASSRWSRTQWPDGAARFACAWGCTPASRSCHRSRATRRHRHAPWRSRISSGRARRPDPLVADRGPRVWPADRTPARRLATRPRRACASRTSPRRSSLYPGDRPPARRRASRRCAPVDEATDRTCRVRLSQLHRPRAARSRTVAAKLLDVGARLVTLTGPGGVGKTRLALDLALALEPAHFLALASVADPALVATTLVQSLGVVDGGEAPAAEVLAGALASEDLLLVLDNLEHLLPAASLVSDLLAGCPRLRVLATSREPLRIRGEQIVPVAPLRQAPAADAVRRPGTGARTGAFALGDANAVGVARDLRSARWPAAGHRARRGAIGAAHRAGGWRCASARHWTPLGAGSRDAPERHQTLRATIGLELSPARRGRAPGLQRPGGVSGRVHPRGREPWRRRRSRSCSPFWPRAFSCAARAA